jgi:PTS system arbutin/cellobiose/salicin-specific IIC component
MAKDYALIAKTITENLGTISNIESVTHCMTRLRVSLKDDSKVNVDEIKKINGVIGYVNQGGQHQVIIGNNVSYVYKEVLKLGNFGEQSDIAKGIKKEKLTIKKVGSNMLDALVSTMSPLIPAIIGGSMVKLVVMILSMLKILPSDSTTYILLNAIGDAAFYFLPIMVAVSASKKFKTNTYLAVAIAGLMVHPDFMKLMVSASEGKEVTLAFIPIASVKYTYTVIPALCMTWILSYIERFVDKITPEVTKNFLKPMIIVLIAAPIAIGLIGPLGIWIGTAISGLVYFVHSKLGWVSVAIMGALWPLLVMTGMHRVFTPTILTTIAETGMEGMVMPSEIGANLSLGGAALAVAYKTKNKELRQTAIAAASSAIIAGITEPSLYGVALRFKRPMIASLITGGVCGAVAGIGGLASRSMAAPGLFTSVQFFDPQNPSSLIWIIGIMILAVVLSFVLTLIFGFEDVPAEDNTEIMRADNE